MSADTDVDTGPDSEAVLETFQQWYQVPALLGVLAYMLWIRTRAYDQFVTDDRVYFRGNDAYYHFRSTMYSVENWPRRLYGEAFTYFPYGQNVGHFGTLFDQFWATVALIVGLGDPSSRQVAAIAVLAPAILGTLVAVPTYFLAKRLSDSCLGGITAAAVLALLPQSAWVRRSTVGFYDHHVAETLLMAVAVFAMVHALVVVRRERPVYEQVEDRDWDGLKPSLRACALAGIALGAYMLTWPSGVVLVGIFGVVFVVAISAAVVRNESPEHVAFAGVVSSLVALLPILPVVRTLDPSVTTTSILHVLMLLSVAAGCIALAALARYWERQDQDPTGYPVAVSAIGAVTLGIAWLVLPDAVNLVWNNMGRILFLGQSDTSLTIGEAQSMDLENLGQAFYTGYGFAAFSAVLALVWIGARGLFSERDRSEFLLVAIWSVFLLLMSITQVRFHYYLVVAAAVLNGWLVVQIVRLMEFPEVTTPEQIEVYHVMTVVVVLMLLFVPVTVGAFTDDAGTPTAAETAEAQQPGTVQLWDENLDWMSESTPEPGEFGGANNAMDYYGPYGPIDDYDYPEGAYGVLSWWDYGHWITVDGERIPTANPFQQGPRAASAFLQETDEERANTYLEALPAGEGVGGSLDQLSDQELQSIVDNRTEQEAQEEVRYVTIDDQMAGGKFGAITEWAGPAQEVRNQSGNVYRERRNRQVAGEERQILSLSQQYDRTMLSRLYFQDARGLEHYRLVKEDSRQQVVASVAAQRGEGVYEPVVVGLDVQTLNQVLPQSVLQAAQNTQDPRYALYDVRQASAVKTFERVEGATLTGTAAANETVVARVPLETDAGRQFTYLQTATAAEDGSFELTVPYATDQELGVEDGYTEPDVVANGTYSVQTGILQPSQQAQGVEVSESAIYEGEEIEVELEEVEQPAQNGSNASDVQIAGSGTATSDAAASGSVTAGASRTDADVRARHGA